MSDIFIKKDDSRLDVYDFMSMIPKDAITCEQPELLNDDLIEYRWRIIRRNGVVMGEISQSDGNVRLFRTHNGSWRTNDTDYDVEVLKSYYYYANKY